MPGGALTIEEALTLLAATPPRIAALTAGLTPGQLRASPAPDEWSANEVLAHLRSCADVWGDCIRAIVAGDRPTVRAVNPRAWIKKTDYPRLEFGPSLHSFTAQRADLLAFLESLSRENWLRAVKMTGAGRGLEWTVLAYARRLARHERVHVEQVEQIVNTLQRDRQS
jgi:hypothetical protein